MLHHLTLWVPDLERAEPSWGWLLGELGYQEDRGGERIIVFRHPSGLAIVLEQSADMVPGMLHSRLRPGLNHVAFRLDSVAALDRILAGVTERGWTILPLTGHPIAGGADVAFLEDQDGFEVELVAPSSTS